MLLVRAGVLLSIVVLAACRPAAGDASLPPVTLPDLSGMEASVQQQISAQFETATLDPARFEAASQPLLDRSLTLGPYALAHIVG